MSSRPTSDMSGNTYWTEDGEFHRDDGPAVIYKDGSQHWYFHGQRHRIGGPAVIEASGTEHWYLCGKAHRIDGPAIIFANGDKRWYVYGERVQGRVRFKQLTYISDEEMSILILKYGDIK